MEGEGGGWGRNRVSFVANANSTGRGEILSPSNIYITRVILVEYLRTLYTIYVRLPLYIFIYVHAHNCMACYYDTLAGRADGWGVGVSCVACIHIEYIHAYI